MKTLCNGEYGAISTKASRDRALWALLDATAFAVYRLRELELAQFHLTVEQASVLDLLQTLGRGITISELVNITLRQHHTMSILINRMVAVGLATKMRPAQEKEFRILITGRGRELLASITTRSLEAAFSSLTSSEKADMARSLLCLREKARSLFVPWIYTFLQPAAGRAPEDGGASEPHSGSRGTDFGLWSVLNRTRFALSRLRELELAQYSLTVEQASILEVLRDGVSRTIKDLEDVTLRQHHSVSILVHRMAKTRLLEVARHPDQRTRRIFITREGKRLFDTITTASIQMTFCSLTEREKRQLSRSLRCLYVKARHLLGYSTPSLTRTPG